MSVAHDVGQRGIVIERSTLPALPPHWRLTRVGSVFEERNERVSDTDYEPLSVTMRGIVPRLDTAAKSDAGDNRKKVLPGDLVINSRSDRRGSSGVSPLRGSVSLICTVLKPRGILPEFAHHLIRSGWFQEEFFRFGRGIVDDLWSTKYSDMKLIQLPLPPVIEQRAIAAFLDRATARIDALIEKKQRLIELLERKRQAVITQAVTRGLDPDVPMKDSGVEWLGAIPSHWILRRLKHSLKAGESVSYGIVQPGEHVDDGVPFIQTSNIGGTEISGDLQRTAPEIAAQYRRSVIHGDEVLLGIRASVGAAHLPEAWMVGFNLSRGIARICPDASLRRTFLLAFLRGPAAEFWTLRSQGSTFSEVSMESVKELPIPTPPLSEQSVIVQWLKEHVDRLDSLALHANRSIELLRERRSALITAAVTGQLDIRDAAA